MCAHSCFLCKMPAKEAFSLQICNPSLHGMWFNGTPAGVCALWKTLPMVINAANDLQGTMLVIVPHDGSCHIFPPAYGQRPWANNVRPHILYKIRAQLFQSYKCQSGRPIWAARHLSFHATLLSKFTLPFCCKYSTMVTQSAAHTGAQKAYTAHSTPSGRRHIPR